MRTAMLVASAGLMLGAGALAKPLNRGWTPSAAPWLVHIDVEAALRSEIGKLGFEGTEPILAEVSNELEEELGFDLFSEVRSVTVYGLTAEHEEPVVIISTTPTAETRLMAMAGAMADATLVENNRTLYKMDPDESGHTHYGTFLAGPDAGERLLVISPIKEHLHGALDIIEGKGRLDANLDQSPLSRGPSAGSIVYVAASQIDRGLDIEPVSVVLQKAEGVRFDMGETNGQMFVEVDIRTVGDQEAVQLQQMIQGGLAMAQFVGGREPEFADIAALAAGVNLGVDGRDLSVRFRHDSKDLVARLAKLEGLDHDNHHNHDNHDDVRHHHKIKVGKDGHIQE